MKTIGIGLLYLFAGVFIAFSLEALAKISGILFGGEMNTLNSKSISYLGIVIFCWSFEFLKPVRMIQKRVIIGLSTAIVILSLVAAPPNQEGDPLMFGIFQIGTIITSLYAVYLNRKTETHPGLSYLLLCFVFLLGLFLPTLYLGAYLTTGVTQNGMALFITINEQLYYAFGRFIPAALVLYMLRCGLSSPDIDNPG